MRHNNLAAVLNASPLKGIERVGRAKATESEKTPKQRKKRKNHGKLREVDGK